MDPVWNEEVNGKEKPFGTQANKQTSKHCKNEITEWTFLYHDHDDKQTNKQTRK